MAAKGTVAKSEVAKKIAAAFGASYVGEYDKKYYVWENDGGGEMVQIAISLTCPKTPVANVAPAALDFGGGMDFEAMDTIKIAQTAFAPAEITEEEVSNIQSLMERLGL